LRPAPQQQQREREKRKLLEREQRRRYEEMEQLRREEERRHAEREQVRIHTHCDVTPEYTLHGHGGPVSSSSDSTCLHVFLFLQDFRISL